MPSLKKVVLDILDKQDYPNFVCVGCGEGEEVVWICQRSRHFEDDLKVYVFNPSVETIIKYGGRLLELGAQIFPVAVSYRCGLFTFYKCDLHRASSSLCKPNIEKYRALFKDIDCGRWSVGHVCAVTLDHFYKVVIEQRYQGGHIPSDVIDVLWSDVNGANVEMLLGAKYCLQKTRYLIVEHLYADLHYNTLNKSELLAMLPDWDVVGEFDNLGNFSNLLLKNKKLN